jgi:hypothetical protein
LAIPEPIVMSSRERWIIYPLLFFAFCLAGRDQLAYLRPQVVEIPRLSCKVIEAKSIDGDIMVAGNLTGNSIQCKKSLEADTVRFNEVDTGILRCERIEVESPNGQRVAELRPTDTGAGQLTLFGPDERPAVVLSYGDSAFGDSALGNSAGKLKSVHADGSQFMLQAAPGGGTLVVLDAEGRVIGRCPVELEDAATVELDDDEPDEDPDGTSQGDQDSEG